MCRVIVYLGVVWLGASGAGSWEGGRWWGKGGAVGTCLQEGIVGVLGLGQEKPTPPEGNRSGLSPEQNLQFLVWMMVRQGI